MFWNRLIIICAAIVSSALLSACASDPAVRRVETDSVTDLSGNWNDTDSRVVAEAMTNDLLSQTWYNESFSAPNALPRIIVGVVRNKSHEHIDTNTFTKDIERNLILSGVVELVASAEGRKTIRIERTQQDLYASAETRKALGQELGADLILQGAISTIIDANADTQARFYQVDLELIDIETTRKLWLGQKKIKKLINKDRVRF